MEPDIILLSFPRSGNHWIRFGVEWMTKRPTMGCEENPRDVSISKNIIEGNPLNDVSGTPVAIKCHYFKEEWHTRSNDVKILCIIRDYRECVPRNAQLTQKPNAFADLDQWTDICKNICKFSGKKCVIYYEDLMLETKRIYAWTQIGNFFGVSASVVDEFLSNHDYFSNLSRLASGRDWGGSISGQNVKFHQKNISTDELNEAKNNVKKAILNCEIMNRYIN